MQLRRNRRGTPIALKLVKRQGSEVWYLRGTVRGQSVFESTLVTDKRQAEAIRAKREWEIVNRDISGAKSVATFNEAASGFLDGGGSPRFLELILAHLGKTPLAEIGQREVEAFAKKHYPNAAPATLARQVFAPISAVMMHGARRKLCDRPVFERPKIPRGRVRWLTYEEADRLILHCAPHLKPIMTFMFFTGCRVSEALELGWREVDLERGHATFLNTKNGESRGMPLHPRANAALAGLRHREGNVFLKPNKRPYEPRESAGGHFKTAFKGACRRAGITDFHPHDCRHTWATWHYAANRDTSALMSLGGWKSVSMVLRYAHVNVSNLAGGIMKLGFPNLGDSGR